MRISLSIVFTLCVVVILGIRIAGLILYGKTADWWNKLRRIIWIPIHGTLVKIGGFSTANVNKKEHVCSLQYDENDIELLLYKIGFRRNPWAALKHRASKRDVSEGSFVTRNSRKWYIPDWLSKYQLHVTIFERKDNGFDMYAHRELNYWTHPRGHLNGDEYSASDGVHMVEVKLGTKSNKLNYDAHPSPIIENQN